MNVFFFFFCFGVLKIRMVKPFFLKGFSKNILIFKKLSTITKPKSASYIYLRNIYVML